MSLRPLRTIAGMADLLVKLYNLQPKTTSLADGIAVRRAFAAEKRLVSQWVLQHFGERWASECEISFMRQPVACFIASNGLEVLGFATYDATARGFFGPTGVMEQARHKGIGRALLFAVLGDMACQGYAYCVIGATTSLDFYRHEVGATEIPESVPGFYAGMLKPTRP
jgi:GNAT superfamily N-acetyltransferase